MFLYGVVNASPDSLNEDSIVSDADSAVRRARRLLGEGADGIDLGGQGSTDHATVVPWESEWARLADVVPAIAALGLSAKELDCVDFDDIEAELGYKLSKSKRNVLLKAGVGASPL